MRCVTASSNTSAFDNLAKDLGCKCFATKLLSSFKHLMTLDRFLCWQAILLDILLLLELLLLMELAVETLWEGDDDDVDGAGLSAPAEEYPLEEIDSG